MWLLLAVLCFALSVAVHALISRARPRANRVVTFAIVAFVAFLGLAWVLFGQYGADVRPWAALCLYALAAELYVFLFTMIGSSITARLLIILRKRDMQLYEIDSAFPTEGMVDDRMRKLLGNGFIRAEGASTYTLTRKGWLLVTGFRPLRSFFRRQRLS